MQPAEHVRRPDHDNDGVEARKARQHSLQNTVQHLRSNAGFSDVADMNVGRPEFLEVLGTLEDALEKDRPGGFLIESIAFDRATPGHKHSIQFWGMAGNFGAAFAISVHEEARRRWEIRIGQ